MASASNQVELVVLTRWTSIESIRAFAGPEISTAVVEPAAAVQHYDVVSDT